MLGVFFHVRLVFVHNANLSQRSVPSSDCVCTLQDLLQKHRQDDRDETAVAHQENKSSPTSGVDAGLLPIDTFTKFVEEARGFTPRWQFLRRLAQVSDSGVGVAPPEVKDKAEEQQGTTRSREYRTWNNLLRKWSGKLDADGSRKQSSSIFQQMEPLKNEGIRKNVKTILTEK